MPSGKLCSRQAKKLYKSQVQSNMGGGGGGGGGRGDLINSQLETRDSLSTAVYSVNIN